MTEPKVLKNKEAVRPNIYQKFQELRTVVQDQVFKSGKNQYYSYAELKDFMPLVNKEMLRLHLFSKLQILPPTADENGVDREIARLEIIDADDPKSGIKWESGTAEAQVMKASPVQNLGAKHTYMRRYMWLLALELAVPDEVEAARGRDEVAPETTKKITKGQIAIINKHPDRISKMLEFYKVEKVEDLTLEQATQAIKALSKPAPQEAPANV